MSISNTFSRITDYFKRNGVWATVRRVGLATRRSLFSSRMILFYFDLSTPGAPTADLPSSVKVERHTNQSDLSLGDLQEITSFWNPELAHRRVQERFELGASLWLIKFEYKLAGFGWTLLGHTVEPHYLRLGPDDVHLFDFHVFPRYRGRGVNPLLVGYILHSLAAECRGRAFIEAAEWNQSQLASLRKTPFRRLGSALKVAILRHTIVCWDENKALEGAQGERVNKPSIATAGGDSGIPDLRA
jgi:ribosomal protein S18 acetylase RimI-like enzyme